MNNYFTSYEELFHTRNLVAYFFNFEDRVI